MTVRGVLREEPNTMQQEQIELVDPSAIVADDNSRFRLKPSRVERLAADIISAGGVNIPVEVEPLNEPGPKGEVYRLTVGFYRHAAVTKLNVEQNAGLLLPCIVRSNPDEATRLRKQISENAERENMSPMDCAISIKRMFDANIPRKAVMEAFARPSGKKGTALAPASNAWVNMTLRFLDLPKPVQAKIHDGLIGVSAAYELTRVSPEKRAAVLARAEADRAKEQEREEREEQKYLEAEAAVEQARTEADSTAQQIVDAQVAIDVAAEDVAVFTRAVKVAEKTVEQAEGEEAKTAKAQLKETRAKLKEAEKAKAAADAVLAKLIASHEKVTEKAQTAAEKLAEARRLKKAEGRGRGEAVSGADIKAAARNEGAAEGPVPLTGKEMRAVVEDLCVDGLYEKVKLIGEAFRDCFSGKLSDNGLYTRLAKITGEWAPKKTAKE